LLGTWDDVMSTEGLERLVLGRVIAAQSAP
jgi:hypothetical protein